MKFLEVVEKYMLENNMLYKGAKVLVGLSGGADSVGLFCVLAKLMDKYALTLNAVHVHHGIRGDEADADAIFCERLCQKYNIPLEIVKMDIPNMAKEAHLSLEEAGRIARYDVFLDRAQKIDSNGKCMVAVAHHMDDQAETMLMNLARGSSLKGLTGMKSTGVRRTQNKEYVLIRPLLCVRKKEIEAWLSGNGQNYCVDKTNLDDSYTRNCIRNVVLPVMEEKINSKVVSNLVNAASELSEANEYISKVTLQAFEKCLIKKERDKITFDKNELKSIDAIIRKRVICEAIVMIAGRAKDIYSVHVKDVDALVEKNVGSSVDLPYEMYAVVGYDDLTIMKKSGGEILKRNEYWTKEGIKSFDVEEDFFEIFKKNSQVMEEKNYTKYFDYDTIKNGLRLRTRQEGDFLCVYADGRKKKLKEFFVEQKVPQKYRDKVLLVADGSEILWVVGMRVSETHKVTDTTKNICKIQLM